MIARELIGSHADMQKPVFCCRFGAANVNFDTPSTNDDLGQFLALLHELH